MPNSDDECLPSGCILTENNLSQTRFYLPGKVSKQRGPGGEDNDNGVQRLFRCSELGCGRSFSSKFKMMRHMLIHSEDRQFRCSLCERCFHRKDHLKNHFQIHNPNKVIHTCNHCQKKYSSLLSFRKHLALHAAEAGDLSCKLCSKSFAGKDEIMYHLKVHSGSRALKGPNERKFKCDQCDRSFFTRKDVKRHMVVHTGVRNFLCQFCPQRFGRKDHLVRHIKKSHAAQVSAAKSEQQSGKQPDSTVNVQSPPTPEKLHPRQPVSMHHHHHHHLEPHGSFHSAFHPDGIMPMLQDSCPTYINIKQESCFPTTPQPSHENQAGSMVVPEDTDHLLKLGDVGQNIIPVSQYFPISTSFSSAVTHFMPSNCYLTSVPSSSSLIQSVPVETVITPIPGPPPIPFSSQMPLDISAAAASLPHFSQAFQ